MCVHVCVCVCVLGCVSCAELCSAHQCVQGSLERGRGERRRSRPQAAFVYVHVCMICALVVLIEMFLASGCLFVQVTEVVNVRAYASASVCVCVCARVCVCVCVGPVGGGRKGEEVGVNFSRTPRSERGATGEKLANVFTCIFVVLLHVFGVIDGCDGLTYAVAPD